jgi:hypothetical protein
MGGRWEESVKAGQTRKREILANPFFVILLATSTLFVVTVLGYLVSPYVLAPAPARGQPGTMSAALAVWLDGHGPRVLGIEFLIMLLSGVLAMATDPWFSPRSRSRRVTGGMRD